MLWALKAASRGQKACVSNTFAGELQRLLHRAPFNIRGYDLKGFPATLRSSCNCATANSSTKPVTPPSPGSVPAYNHHILIRLPPPPATATYDIWWPPILEKEPALVQAFAGVAEAKPHVDGNVKVTAYEELPAIPGYPKAGEVDLIIFPEGLQYVGIPIKHVKDFVKQYIRDTTEETAGQNPPKLDKVVKTKFEGVGLFVCTHMQRDTRCGIIGSEVAKALQIAIDAEGLDRIRVYQVSHVGGHKYAGNVVVYGGMTPCDGDWFGGITKENAARFLRALVEMQVDMEGGAECPQLRGFWRGRMHLSREEQSQLFENPKGFYQNYDDSELEDSSSLSSSASYRV